MNKYIIRVLLIALQIFSLSNSAEAVPDLSDVRSMSAMIVDTSDNSIVFRPRRSTSKIEIPYSQIKGKKITVVARQSKTSARRYSFHFWENDSQDEPFIRNKYPFSLYGTSSASTSSFKLTRKSKRKKSKRKNRRIGKSRRTGIEQGISLVGKEFGPGTHSITVAAYYNRKQKYSRGTKLVFTVIDDVGITPTVAPTAIPTKSPTSTPTVIPTEFPTAVPTNVPTSIPTEVPTVTPPTNNGDISDVMRKLASWRTEESSGVTCASCHAPDGFDLAMLDYPDKDLVRRAEPHVGLKVANEIVDLIHTVRSFYKINNPRDRKQFRPFQPGGEVLPGKSPFERDESFGRYLRDTVKFDLIADKTISSFEDAKKAVANILSLELSKVKIGIPLNRWTEDAFNGSDHNTLADWMPSVPRIPISGKKAEWLAINDDYIRNPNRDNFWKLYNAIDTHTTAPSGFRLARSKYKSVMLAQHLFRKATLSGKSLDDALSDIQYIFEPSVLNVSPKGVNEKDGLIHNPFWDVGEFTRIFHLVRNDGCMYDHVTRRESCIGIPDNVRQNATRDHSLQDQFNAITLPWFWTGWLIDQGLLRTSKSGSTRSGEYFRRHMIDKIRVPEHPMVVYKLGKSNQFGQRFNIHNVFMFARKTMVNSFIEETFSDDRLKRVKDENNGRLPFSIATNEWSRYDWHIRSIDEIDRAGTPELNDMYKRIGSNLFLMQLYYLREDELPKVRKINENQRKRFRTYLDAAGKFFRASGTKYSGEGFDLINDVRSMVDSKSG